MQFEALMKKILVNGLSVCNRKCVSLEDRDYLTSFEKNCVIKCTENYVQKYFKSQQMILTAFPEPKKDNDF